jgi:hypothetical protein
MEEGAIQVDSIQSIGLPDITPELARESGFLGVLDLLKVAKHGRGENIYLIRFHYVRPRGKRAGPVRSLTSASLLAEASCSVCDQSPRTLGESGKYSGEIGKRQKGKQTTLLIVDPSV